MFHLQKHLCLTLLSLSAVLVFVPNLHDTPAEASRAATLFLFDTHGVHDVRSVLLFCSLPHDTDLLCMDCEHVPALKEAGCTRNLSHAQTLMYKVRTVVLQDVNFCKPALYQTLSAMSAVEKMTP